MMFSVAESYAIEKRSSTLRNSGCRVESLLSDNSVDPKKPRAKAESLLSDNYVDPMKLRVKGRISLE